MEAGTQMDEGRLRAGRVRSPGRTTGALISIGGALWLLVAFVRPPAAATSASPTEGAIAAHTEPLVQPSRGLASDGALVTPSAASTASDGRAPLHPHPITAAHERIFRENALVGALDRAVELEDAAQLRELVATYRAEYPEDEHRLQGGYAIIADCLERLDDAARERARHFWQTEIRSQTRRYVRRHCLDGEVPAR
jgi:hypothetical protein